MNFRVFASGLMLILVYQVAIAAVVIWFAVHCELARGEPGRGEPARAGDAIGMTAGERG